MLGLEAFYFSTRSCSALAMAPLMVSNRKVDTFHRGSLPSAANVSFNASRTSGAALASFNHNGAILNLDRLLESDSTIYRRLKDGGRVRLMREGEYVDSLISEYETILGHGELKGC